MSFSVTQIENSFTSCLTNGVDTAGGTSLKELTIFLESSLLLEKPNLIVQKYCTSCELQSWPFLTFVLVVLSNANTSFYSYCFQANDTDRLCGICTSCWTNACRSWTFTTVLGAGKSLLSFPQLLYSSFHRCSHLLSQMPLGKCGIQIVLLFLYPCTVI